MKTRFRDLSGFLKTAVVITYIFAVAAVVDFILNIIAGIRGF